MKKEDWEEAWEIIWFAGSRLIGILFLGWLWLMWVLEWIKYNW